MKTLKLIIFLTLTMLCLSCSVFKSLDNDSRLLNCILTDKFKSFSKLCDKKESMILVYNNLNDFKDSLTLNDNCGKNILILKSNIKIDVNSSSRIRESKIVLYQYEIIRNKYKLSFVETATNSTLTMVFDKNNKLISYNNGAF